MAKVTLISYTALPSVAQIIVVNIQGFLTRCYQLYQVEIAGRGMSNIYNRLFLQKQ